MTFQARPPLSDVTTGCSCVPGKELSGGGSGALAHLVGAASGAARFPGGAERPAILTMNRRNEEVCVCSLFYSNAVRVPAPHASLQTTTSYSPNCRVCGSSHPQYAEWDDGDMGGLNDGLGGLSFEPAGGLPLQPAALASGGQNGASQQATGSANGGATAEDVARRNPANHLRRISTADAGQLVKQARHASRPPCRFDARLFNALVG